MSSTDHCIGFGETRASSRVLKPPGGGHSNIFAPDEVKKPHARAKYDQQNSTNLNFCMNTVDPNEKVSQISSESQEVDSEVANTSQKSEAPQAASAGADESAKNPNLPTYHHHRSTALW